MSTPLAYLDPHVLDTAKGLLERLEVDYNITSDEVLEEVGISSWEFDAAMHGESPHTALKLVAASLRVLAAEVEEAVQRTPGTLDY